MPELDIACKPVELDLIDRAFSRLKVRSFVDLGACWGVNAGYSFHALDRFDIQRAVVVDRQVTRLTHERAAYYPRLELVESALGAPATIDRVGRVDCAIVFDVLLKQVSPDWNDLLAAYAEKVNSFVIFNRNWYGGAHTVRFPDFSLEEYLRRVYHSDAARVREWFGRHDQESETPGQPWRDSCGFWQWGITQKDLVARLWDLGFRVDFFQSYGQFSARFSEVRNDALIAVRR